MSDDAPKNLLRANLARIQHEVTIRRDHGRDTFRHLCHAFYQIKPLDT
jgi:hypothetical protein